MTCGLIDNAFVNNIDSWMDEGMIQDGLGGDLARSHNDAVIVCVYVCLVCVCVCVGVGVCMGGVGLLCMLTDRKSVV